MSIFGDRLRQLREEKGLTTDQLAKEIGVGRTTLTNYETGLRRPKTETLNHILDFFNVDVNWLEGKTEIRNVYNFDGIYKAGYQDGLKDAESKSDLDESEEDLVNDFRELYDWEKRIVIDLIKSLLEGNHTKNDYVFRDNEVPYRTLDLYGTRPAAGSGNLLPESMVKSEIQVIDNQKTKRASFALKVDGHSMEPKYMDGDTILVEKRDAIDPGEIGVFLVNGSAVIKQAQPGYLHSLNSEYPDINLNESDDVICFGKVIGKL